MLCPHAIQVAVGSKKGRQTAVHGALSAISTGARTAPAPSRPPSRGRVGASKLALRAISAILVSSMGAGTALATDAALPDHALYGVKTATEQLRLGLARSADQQVAVLLDIADARLREAVALESTARHAEAGAAVSAYGEHVARAAAQLQVASGAAVPVSVERFRTEVAKQQETAETSREAGASTQDALSFVADMGTILGRSSAPEPHEIAAAAADAAQRAAARVEQSASATTLTPAQREQTPTQVAVLPAEHRLSNGPTQATARTSAPAGREPDTADRVVVNAASVTSSVVTSAVTTPAATTAATSPAVTTAAATAAAATPPALTTAASGTTAPAETAPAATTAAAPAPVTTAPAATTPAVATSAATISTATTTSATPAATTAAITASSVPTGSSGSGLASASATEPTTARGGASQPPAERPAAATEDKKKHEAVAKAARESAERAKAAADEAKRAAEKHEAKARAK